MGKTVANAKEIEMAKKCVSAKSSSQLLHSGTRAVEVAMKMQQRMNSFLCLTLLCHLHHCATVQCYVLDFLSVLILCHVLWLDKGRAKGRRRDRTEEKGQMRRSKQGVGVEIGEGRLAA